LLALVVALLLSGLSREKLEPLRFTTEDNSQKELEEMSKLLKTLERTVILETWTNRIGRKALREIEDAYRRMLEIMVDYAVKYKASQSTLHRAFYSRFRKEYPWLLTRIIKGCYRDAARRAKSFRELQEKGMAKTSKPEVMSYNNALRFTGLETIRWSNKDENT